MNDLPSMRRGWPAVVFAVAMLLSLSSVTAPAARAADGGKRTATAAVPSDASARDAAESANAENAEDDMTLAGGTEGTVFGTLTVKGEDRISIEFERPELSLNLDPRDAPGLEWGDPLAVLQRSGIDLSTPYLASTATIPSRGFAAAWAADFREDAVARFQPNLEDVERWELTVVDSRSDTVAVFRGQGEPPREIAWNGMRLDGQPAAPGLTYSYVLAASDKAGNHRTFPGSGFEIPPYRLVQKNGVSHLFAARSLPAAWRARPAGTPPALLLEVASQLNRERVDRPVEVRVRARTFAEANTLAEAVRGVLRNKLLGDPARIRAVTDVRPDAPEGGTVAIVSLPAERKS